MAAPEKANGKMALAGRQMLGRSVTVLSSFSANNMVISVRASLTRVGVSDRFNPFPRPPEKLKPMSSCDVCGKKAAYWCVDCHQLTCPGCTARFHHPGSKNTKHSIEEIDWAAEAGAQITGPLFGNILLFIGMIFIVQATMAKFNENYMATVNICPMVRFASHWMAAFDTKVFYYFKSDLASFCSMEDSFFRLFLDGWVRNVVTDTDDTLLVLITSVKAVMVSLVVRKFLAPVVAVLYALSTELIAAGIDPLLTLSLSERMIKQIEDFLKAWQPLSRVGPPLTKLRRRPDIDDLEMLQYRIRRVTRGFRHAYADAANQLDYYIFKLVMYAVGWRLVFIWSADITGFRIGSVLRALLHPVLGNTIDQHRQWFGASAPDTFSDESLWYGSMAALRSLLAFKTTVAPGGTNVIVLKFLVLVLSLVVLRRLAYYFIFDVYLKRQQDEFEAKWKAPGDWSPMPGGDRMQDSVGACSARDCACSCCQYWAPDGFNAADTN